MLCIVSKSHDAYFNIASEEYLLKNFDEDIFLLYRNEPCIIVGQHQNTLSGINVEYVRDNNIKVVRRLSGGGTVFHDLGNLNFSFHMRNHGEDSNDFRKYTQPIIDVLQKLGVDARFEGRNDLTIDGKKFSGNAKYLYKNKILQHGTLLFSSRMTDLSAALQVHEMKFSDKAVKSVIARVTNISEHLSNPMELDDFTKMIVDHVKELYPNTQDYEFTSADNETVDELISKKYGTWDWNFGQSPKYNLRKMIRTTAGTIEFDLEVKQGLIKEIRIFGDYFSKKDVSELEQLLQDVEHDERRIREALAPVSVQDYIINLTLEDFIGGIF